MRFPAITALVVVALLGTRAGAQTPPTQTIRVFGGLLGQVEGFCEDPGGTYDWNQPKAPGSQVQADAIKAGGNRTGTDLVKCGPENGSRGSRWVGGSFGLTKAIAKAAPQTSDLLIVGGNNRGAQFGQRVWDHIAALAPTVVALGPEDFVRAMTGNDTSKGVVKAPLPASHVVSWVRGESRLPFLASNVAIRRVRSGLTTVEDNGFTLHVDDEDDTVSWIASLKIDGALTKPSAELEEFAQVEKPKRDQPRQPARSVTVEAGKDGEDATVTFSPALRPDRWYRLTLSDDGTRVAAFIFQTEQALTPIHDSRVGLSGYPVKMTADGAWLIVSLVDPGTAARMASSAWKWEDGDAEREMVFLDPKKVLTAALGLKRDADVGAAKGPSNMPDPDAGVILVSSLTDEATMALLEDFPQIRVVVLHPQSELIGRASATGARELETKPGSAADKTRFSGDLGFAAILNRQYPEATKVLMRPEWFGETLLTLRTDVARSLFDYRDRTLGDANVIVDVVPGAALDSSSDGTMVTYVAKFGSETEQIGRAPLYRDCAPGSGGACADFRAIFEGKQLAGAIGDALRLRDTTDMAVFSTELIDEDYAGYVERRLTTTSTNWISKYILERLVYASPRIVKGRVSGAELVATLAKAIKEDATLCISGIGSACPSSVDATHPERLIINGRQLNPRLFYSIALPDSLAESLGISHDDGEGVNVVEALDQFLAGGKWLLEPAGDTPPLSERLEDQRSRTPQFYFAASTFDLGLTYVQPEDPENGTGVRKNLGLPFSGAEESRTVTVTLDSDLGLLDAQSFAVRVPASVRYSRRKEPTQVTFDTDEFATGLRFDLKYGVARPFVGYFIDGQIEEHSASLTASRKLNDPARAGFEISETAKFSTGYIVEPRRYRHFGAGLELVELAAFPIAPAVTVNLRKLGGRWTKGSESNVPIGLTIGDEAQSLDDFLATGDKAVLNAYFTGHPDTFSEDVKLAIEPKRVEQTRLQADLDGEVTWKVKSREYTGELKVRFRYYDSPGEALSPFLLSSDTRVEVKLGVPLFWRFKFVPSYTYQRATIEADTNDVFRYSMIDLKISLPFVARFGRGRLVR